MIVQVHKFCLQFYDRRSDMQYCSPKVWASLEGVLEEKLSEKVDCVIRSMHLRFGNILSNEYEQLDVWEYINASHGCHSNKRTYTFARYSLSVLQP